MAIDLVQAIQNLCDRADEATDGVKEAIAATRADISAGTCRDPAKAAQNLAVVAGIMVDKAHRLAFEGIPEPAPDITIDPKQAAQELARRLGITDDYLRRHREIEAQIERDRLATIDQLTGHSEPDTVTVRTGPVEMREIVALTAPNSP